MCGCGHSIEAIATANAVVIAAPCSRPHRWHHCRYCHCHCIEGALALELTVGTTTTIIIIIIIINVGTVAVDDIALVSLGLGLGVVVIVVMETHGAVHNYIALVAHVHALDSPVSNKFPLPGAAATPAAAPAAAPGNIPAVENIPSYLWLLHFGSGVGVDGSAANGGGSASSGGPRWR